MAVLYQLSYVGAEEQSYRCRIALVWSCRQARPADACAVLPAASWIYADLPAEAA